MSARSTSTSRSRCRCQSSRSPRRTAAPRTRPGSTSGARPTASWARSGSLRSRRYKAEVDPGGIMNPGKVLGSGVIDLIMGSATAFEPLIRPIANVAKPPSWPGRPVEGRQRHPGRRRVHGVRLRALRLLRADVRAVLRAWLGVAVTARQVRLHPRGHGGHERSGTARRSTRCSSAPRARSATRAASCSCPSSTTGWRCAASSSTRRSAARSRRSR